VCDPLHQHAPPALQAPDLDIYLCGAREALDILAHDHMCILHSDNDEEFELLTLLPHDAKDAHKQPHTAELPQHAAADDSEDELADAAAGRGELPLGDEMSAVTTSSRRVHSNSTTRRVQALAYAAPAELTTCSTAAVIPISPTKERVRRVPVPVFRKCPHRTPQGERLVRQLDLLFEDVYPEAVQTGRGQLGWAYKPASASTTSRTHKQTERERAFHGNQPHQLRAQGRAWPAGLQFLLREASTYMMISPREETAAPWPDPAAAAAATADAIA
jgi:hypothetical protein